MIKKTNVWLKSCPKQLLTPKKLLAHTHKSFHYTPNLHPHPLFNSSWIISYYFGSNCSITMANILQNKFLISGKGGKALGLKIRRSVIWFPVQVMCKSVRQTLYSTLPRSTQPKWVPGAQIQSWINRFRHPLPGKVNGRLIIFIYARTLTQIGQLYLSVNS